MSKQGIKLVQFLDNIMGCGAKARVNSPVAKDATVDEMKRHCKEYPCNACPIYDRCGMADTLYS